MANNRLYLKCKICGKAQAFAKYYPVEEGAGWYLNQNNLDDFFDEHHHELDFSPFGDYQYEMEYEIPKKE